ncbi:MAG: phosphate ABC transporter permease subunit PstC [Planctomycetes bacterium]|nr:phosphate ABC transporter permease subunit PstC [Planctomycetota bacterium]
MRGWQRLKEGALHAAFFACALISIAVTVGIIWVLFSESLPFFRSVPIRDFLFGLEWAPRTGQAYGILPLVCGTLLTSVLALGVAIPIGLATALYMSEYASPTVRGVAKPVFEILAGIPTVVYGYFALSFITPTLLRPLFPTIEVFNALSAAIVMGVMIIPTISSLCDDAFRAVPRRLREAGYALSATKLEVSTRIVLPAAMSGVVAAVLLALARAVGETGSTPKVSLDPLGSTQTIAAYIVQVSKGDAPAGTIEYQSIYIVGLTLFAITLGVNLLAQRVMRRFREVYE